MSTVMVCAVNLLQQRRDDDRTTRSFSLFFLKAVRSIDRNDSEDD